MIVDLVTPFSVYEAVIIVSPNLRAAPPLKTIFEDGISSVVPSAYVALKVTPLGKSNMMEENLIAQVELLSMLHTLMVQQKKYHLQKLFLMAEPTLNLAIK